MFWLLKNQAKFLSKTEFRDFSLKKPEIRYTKTRFPTEKVYQRGREVQPFASDKNEEVRDIDVGADVEMGLVHATEEVEMLFPVRVVLEGNGFHVVNG